MDQNKNSVFTDLTPVDDADEDNTYSDALEYAFSVDRIKNIALTGPYGSGKSSIIRTFEKNSSYKFLNISLASFKEEGIGKVDSKSIERSILQQMLYGADANILPYSRFKRISTPSHPLLKSFLFVLWASISLLLYFNKIDPVDYLSFSIGSFEWFFGATLFALLLSVPVAIVNKLYKASFSVSLKKLSLKNAEIEAGDISEDSILNRHLDEIIYFFQVTDYNAVVIEDLDRFEDPEIFVKLREINALVNNNAKTKGIIKFLYALKDDMFVHTNRAKFFDFIIPVVPIINSNNSLDMMQRKIEKHHLKKEIDSQFLREVSFYVDDLRLIHNIFNEFTIYYRKLKSDNYNVTKLLSMMVYKNVYPNDFEKLHHGSGVLFDICNKKSEFLSRYKNRLRKDLEEATIIAPFDGTVANIGIKEGEFLSPADYSGTTIVELVDLGHMELTARVDELDVVKVKTGQKVLISIDAMPETKFEGLVTFISPVARELGTVLFEDEDEEKEYEVKIKFSIPKNSPIRDGMSATAEIIIE